jgi:hypothetical protein
MFRASFWFVTAAWLSRTASGRSTSTETETNQRSATHLTVASLTLKAVQLLCSAVQLGLLENNALQEPPNSTYDFAGAAGRLENSPSHRAMTTHARQFPRTFTAVRPMSIN